jgi:pyocin large subunit-like protein
MSPRLLRLVVLIVILGVSWFLRNSQNAPGTTSGGSPAAAPRFERVQTSIGSAAQTWGRIDTLEDHFARHGGDFGARNAEEYAAQAEAFLHRAKATGLPAKRDTDGSLRIYDSATGTFGAYNANGTTRTFFKPGSADYFDHQPGERIDLRTAR